MRRLPKRHIAGERWLLYDGREITVVKDMANGFLKVFDKKGKLEVIEQSYLKQRI